MTMDNVIKLPEAHEVGRVRRDLARYLRVIADGIEADDLETEPHAFALVLTGMSRHEVLWAGYKADADGFMGARFALDEVSTASFRRRGENVCLREGGRYGRPHKSENVVEFAPPRTKADRP